MEHLDLEGMLSTTSATWLLPAFDQQDAIYLSSSRQMLEPIMEETSEDEDNQNWSQYENAWSSESDTGSVIRIELHNEQDTVSERDLACPAKRPRRSEDLLIFEESAPMHVHHHQPQASQSQLLHSPQTRKFYRNENIFSANDVSENYRKRFDELCSDSDSLSYNSLSRSSSLIQFESLERQFQNDLSSLGNSSPSLLSFIENEELAKQGSESSLRRYESSEGRLHQTYFNLDKIDFTNGLIFSENSQNHNYQLKSDSESSDNSILSHEERIPKMNVNQISTNDQRISNKTGKSSAENLSEDSGYGEYSTGLRAKSKSIPNFLRTCDKFCEEDEFEHRKSLELIYKEENSKNIVSSSATCLRSRQENKEYFSKNFSTETTATKIDRNNELKLRKMSPLPSLAAGNLQPQLCISARTEFFTAPSDQPQQSHAQRQFYNNVEDAAKVSDDHDNDHSDDDNDHNNSDGFSEEDNYCGRVKNKLSTTLPTSSHISVSLPDVRIQYNHDFDDDGNNCSDPRSCDYRRTLGSTNSNYYQNDNDQYTSVTSLPENLNLFGLSGKSSSDGIIDCILKPNDDFVINSSERLYEERDDCVWNSRSRSPAMLTRSENRLEDKYFGFLANVPSEGKPSTQKVQSFHLNYMNASYNNLTLLDYSGRSKSFTMSDYNSAGNSKRNSREMDLGKGNFLLDELSAHFDRNLSIISDRARDSDLVSEFINNEKYNHNKNEKPAEDSSQINKRSKVPPKPPIRRSSMKRDPPTTEPETHIEVSALPPCMNKTFDLDPTNLKTTYAESLEKCNFDPKELSSTDLSVLKSSRNEHYRQTSASLKRGFVASTPNLNTFRSNPDELNKFDDEMHVSSAHTSMNRLPGEKKLGILLTSGSRNSLSKGVSFCPIVSEISWRDQSSDECVEPDSLENVHHDDHLASSEDDSEFSDDDNDDGGFADRQRNPEQLITVAVTTATSFANNNSNNPQLDSNTNNKIEVKAEITNRNTNIDSVIACNSNDNHNTSLDEHKQRKQLLHDPSGSSMAEQEPVPMKTACNPSQARARAKASDSTIAHQSSSDVGDLSVASKPRSVEGNSKFYCDYNSVPYVRDSVINRHRSDDEMMFDKSESVINSSKTVNTRSVKLSTKTKEGIVYDMPNSRNTTTNTGTDLLKQKFMVKPDEKHHKNGFLSRFAGGFRFSLRRKKKPTPVGVVDDDKNSNENASRIFSRNKKAASNGSSPVKNNVKSSDIVHIPLHPSVNERDFDKPPKAGLTSSEEILSQTYAGNIEHNGRHLSDFTPNYIDSSNHVLVGKPPLPKQPPRVVGVCEKIRACQTGANIDVPNIPYDRHAQHASHNTIIHKTREIDGRFLDNERQYYRNQFDGTMNGSGSSSNNNILPPPPSFAETIDDNNRPLYTTQISDSIAVPVGGLNNINVANNVATNSKHKIGLIETNLDTHETIITGKTRSLMELGPQVRLQLHKQNPGTCHQHETHIDDGTSRRPHKSMEFLLDKENQKNVLVSFGNSTFQKSSWLRKALNHIKPPENELQKTHDSTATLSEHQLRVQASLQRLNIPDWFRQYNSTPKPATETAYKPGAFTRKRASDSGRWAGLNSKTTSLSSLGSQRSDRSPLMLSPSAHSHTGGQIGFSRWSTSHLNSTQTSPSISTRGSFSRGGVANSSFISGHSVGSTSIRSSFRQPYLGWRSQEKLSQPRTPHERLASSLLAQQQQSPKPDPVVTPEIQSSIKEVTSAIVHYVNDQTNRTSRSRSTSPNSRRCWLESSFVGTRPLESPQTPVIDNSFNTTVTSSIHSGTTSDGGFRMNGVEPLDRSSAGSASLEDVLASLLGLPTATYRSTGDSANETGMLRTTSGTSSSSLQVEQQNRFRRRSEGDAQRQHAEQQQHKPQPNQQNSQPNDPKPPLNPHNTSELSLPSQVSRRVSLDSSESKTTSEIFVKCRNTKCDQSASPIDAKKYYKSCHNCSHLYCSRECRRAHWEKHRKACLHSRVSNLCRQVLSSCKDDIDTLRHLSLLARKGYLSQGRGVVRILFRSPENAEGFIKNGFQCMGEASYVRWPDLMPAEMGLELYSELLRLSTEYKPDSKMLIYVAICVVSEAPGTGTAPVKWERQLVSRCAKLKLCKAVLAELDQTHQLVVVKEPSMEILILTFNTQRRSTPQQREMILTNIQLVLSKRGVILRKHYPEIYQRLQTFVEGQTDRFLPVTMHPRDSTTGQGFVCIIMPNHGEGELIRLPTSDTGNRVSTIDVGEEVLES